MSDRAINALASSYSQGIFARIANVQESILVLVFLVYGTHQRSSGGQHFIDKDEDCLLWRELE